MMNGTPCGLVDLTDTSMWQPLKVHKGASAHEVCHLRQGHAKYTQLWMSADEWVRHMHSTITTVCHIMDSSALNFNLCCCTWCAQTSTDPPVMKSISPGHTTSTSVYTWLHGCINRHLWILFYWIISFCFISRCFRFAVFLIFLKPPKHLFIYTHFVICIGVAEDIIFIRI